MRWIFILGAFVIAGCAIFGCAGPNAELAIKGRAFPMDAADCARISANVGGQCYVH